MSRRLFNRFRALARECGPVTVYAQKTAMAELTREAGDLLTTLLLSGLCIPLQELFR